MRIYEYETKELLAEKGVAAPRSGLAHSADEAAELAARIGGPVAIKAQTLLKARGKAGLIKFAEDPAQAKKAATELLGREHRGEKVAALLVEEKLNSFTELYLGLVVDYTACHPVVLASTRGGMDIEEVASREPAKILRVEVPPSKGISSELAREVAEFLAAGQGQTGPGLIAELSRVVQAAYQLFSERDLEMLEINPLALTSDGRILALDGAAAVDGDALFRQEELNRARNQTQDEFDLQKDFAARGWSYLQLEGDIGILSSGAGITMAILDLMRMQGGRPANFLDTAQMDRKGIYDAFHIFLDDPSIKTVLVNIFAGLNRCDHLAGGIKDFLEQYKPAFKVVVRMIGNRDEEGKQILQQIGISPIRELEPAVEQAIAVTEEPK
jgi:succinyl-CoA synthetase beta subunit